MQSKIIALLFLVAILSGACVDLTVQPTYITETPLAVTYITATPQEAPSATRDAGTVNPTSIHTEAPTERPSATFPYMTLAPTDNPGGEKVERSPNPGMEGVYELWPQDGGHTAPGWRPVYCHTESPDISTPEDCNIPLPCEGDQEEGCNPPSKMIVAEYKQATLDIDPRRVNDGYSAQGWHCRSAHCWAGVYADVAVNRGHLCLVQVWVQTWGARDWRSNVTGEPYRSDYDTEDDQRNMTFEIAVHVAGAYPPRPFSIDSPMERKEFGFEDGIYDTDGGAFVELEFLALEDRAVIFFLGRNLWPTTFSEWYIDSASVKCDGDQSIPSGVDQTPTPIVESP